LRQQYKGLISKKNDDGGGGQKCIRLHMDDPLPKWMKLTVCCIQNNQAYLEKPQDICNHDGYTTERGTYDSSDGSCLASLPNPTVR
jgi:hypothetical protein